MPRSSYAGFFSLLALALSLVLPVSAQVKPAQPNVVIIITDDQGYADVGFNGSTEIPTPHIDRIANEGVRFTQGYVTFSVCGPSRAGLLTGRYQDRFGFVGNPTMDPADATAGIPLTEKNLAELLKPAGYTSMAVGKWHLGTHPTLRPLSRGFDEFFGFLSGGHRYFPEDLTLNDLSEVKRHNDWYRTRLLRNNKRVDIDDYLTDELSDAAVDFVERRHNDGPFFLYLAYNAPHAPMQATRKYLDRFPEIEDKKRRTYAAMVSAVDDGVGRLLDTLDRLDLVDDTVVFFLSDNGGASNNGSDNRPLRGHKGSLFEGGLRVPFAMRWPAKIKPGQVYRHPVSSLDIAATAVAHAGAGPAPGRPLDGADLLPYLTGKKDGPPHDILYWRMPARDDDPAAPPRGEGLAILRHGMKGIYRDDVAMLFNLDQDPGEQNDLAASKPRTLEELRALVEQWSKDYPGMAFPGRKSWP